MTTLTRMADLAQALIHAWTPYFLLLTVAYVLARFLTKTIRTARRNAEIRAARAARDAYLAPVIDITHRLPQRPEGHTA